MNIIKSTSYLPNFIKINKSQHARNDEFIKYKIIFIVTDPNTWISVIPETSKAVEPLISVELTATVSWRVTE